MFVAGSVVACSNSNNGDELPDANHGSTIDAQPQTDSTPVVAAPDLSGTWQYTSGDFLPDQQLGNLQSLILNSDGTGSVNSESSTGNVQGCASMTYIVLSSNVLALNIGEFGTHAHARGVHHLGSAFIDDAPQTIFGGGVTGGTELLNFALAGDILTITDANGAVATFTHHADIASQCLATSLPTIIDLPSSSAQQPQNGGQFLSSDGTDLWYSTGDQTAQAIDPSDGSAATSVSLTNEPTTLFAIGSDGELWLDYGSGGSSLYLYSQDGTSVLTLDLTQAPYNLNVNIDAATVDGQTLWLYVTDESNNQAPELLSIDLSTDTPTLTNTLPFPAEFGVNSGIAFANGKLWLVGFFLTPAIVEVDPTTGAATATYSLPFLPDGYYYRGGLAVIGSDFYTFTQSNQTGGDALVHVTIP